MPDVSIGLLRTILFTALPYSLRQKKKSQNNTWIKKIMVPFLRRLAGTTSRRAACCPRQDSPGLASSQHNVQRTELFFVLLHDHAEQRIPQRIHGVSKVILVKRLPII